MPPPATLPCGPARLRASFVAAVLGAATTMPAAAPPGPTPRPPALPYRVEEDWRFLRDPAQRTEPLDALKYLPLDPRGDVVVALGGEFRHRWEYYRNDAWGAIATQDDNGYHHLRAMLHADVRSAGGWRGYLELKSGLVRGSTTLVKPPDRDDLDLHQAFVEHRRETPAGVLTARVGRQELNYGGMRIVTFRDGPNVRQSFDAALLRLQRGPVRWDAFYARPAETDPGIFDDQTNDTQLIYGLYRVQPMGLVPGTTLDLYLLGYGRDQARFQPGQGQERRYSVGARWSGRRGALDLNFEALWQWGRFRGGDISAWTFASDTGWTWSALPTRPRTYLKANIISGDRRPGDTTLHTFNALYPRGAYFGDIGLLGPANLINLHPGISGRFTPTWGYHLDAVFYWRESDRDGLFNAGGALVRPGLSSRARYIGTQADATLTWAPTRQFSVDLTYARFWSGRFLRESGPARDVDYASLLTRFRF